MGLLEYTKCPFCESGKYKQLFSGKDFLFSKEEFSVVKCQDCGLRYTNPRVKQDQIKSYYYTGYSSYESPDLGLNKKNKNVLYRFFGNIHFEVLEFIKSVNARTVLEIGPGNGSLLYFLKDQGFDVCGVELDSSSAQKIMEHGVKCYSGDLNSVISEMSGKKFDIVILCQAFEHLYNPKMTLTNIHKILNDNGALYLSLPNSGSMEARLFGKFWRGFDLPRHIVHYDKKTIKSMLNKSGFSVIAQYNQNFPSSFVESLGFCLFRKRKISTKLYYFLYYLWKLISPIHLRLIGSGVMTVISVNQKGCERK
ncbi:MAG: class I SAM-dependent methyltransferase [Candidatus Omnitrophota bacterium]